MADDIRNITSDNTNKSLDLGVIVVIPEFNDEDKTPDDIIGSEILEMGTPFSNSFMGGGIIIRYKTKLNEIKTMVLEFDEMGAWIYNRS